MSVPNAPAVARCSFEYTVTTTDGDPLPGESNVIHVASAGNTSISDALATDVAEVISGWWTDEVAALTTDQLQLDRTTCMPYRGVGSPTFQNASVVPGTITASSPLPPNVTHCYKFLTALAGRRYRGRFYRTGMVQNQTQDNAHVFSTAAVDFVTALEVLRTSIDGMTGDLALVVFSRTRYNLGTPPVASSACAQPVTFATVTDFVLDTQRRRIRKAV